MLENRNNRELFRDVIRGVVRAELRGALGTLPAMQRNSGVVQTNIVNGYYDENGDFQECWMAGDVVTEDGEDSKAIAPY